jgi:hypothetical protein
MNSNTIIIEQKISGTGTIHDLASEHYDREIVFEDGDEYAIVLAAYYGNNVYYIASDGYAAADISRREQEYSHAIIDRNGNHMDRDIFCRQYDTLVE